MKLIYGSIMSLLALGILKSDAQSLEEVSDIPQLDESSTRCSKELQTVHMNLSGVGLGSLPDDIVDSPYVVLLDLSNNNIKSISQSAFRKLPNLQTLDLSKNKIEVTEVFSCLNLSSLVTLKLQFQRADNEYDPYSRSSHNSQKRDLSFIYLPHLKMLDLQGSGNLIMELYLNTITPQLTYLDLSMSVLTTCKFMDDLPSTITHLILDDTEIKAVSTERLKNIEELSLNRNFFTTLCFDKCYVTRPRYGYANDEQNDITIGARTLKRLELSGNRIREILIRDANSPFVLLKLLDLSSNEIRYIPPSFNKLFPNLTHLSLSNNRLQLIPNMCSMNLLESMDLSSNNIEFFAADSLCTYENLKDLRLENNRISVFDKSELNRFPILINLNLSNNSLEVLEKGWIQAGNKLEVLWLTDNRFNSSCSLELSDLHHLRELHVENNPLLFIRASDIANISGNLTIYLNSIGIPETSVTTTQAPITTTSRYNYYYG